MSTVPPKQAEVPSFSTPINDLSRPAAPRVFIVTNVRLYSEGLARTLSGRDGLTVLGAATPSEEMLSRIVATAPNLVLVDAATLRCSGIVAQIHSASPRCTVVAFGVSEEPAEVLECAEAGVAGYVLQTASVEDLVKTLLSVQRGELPCSPRIAAMMFKQVASLSGQERTTSPLTLREQGIAGLIGRGLSNKEIASTLSVEVATVKSHVHHILEKLGVTRRAAVADRLRGDDRRSHPGVHPLMETRPAGRWLGVPVPRVPAG
jgi:two-component system nitrate/nitrite response regulator NarL